MPLKNNNVFVSKADLSVASEYLGKGYVIFPSESPGDSIRIRNLICQMFAEYIGADVGESESESFLNNAHCYVGAESLNDLRLKIIQEMNLCSWIRPAFFRLAQQKLSTIVGNELAMQMRLNLSIQLPGDVSSLLPVHADTWSGDSPFEVVVWMPLVNCYGTKAMYILPSEKCERPSKFLAENEGKNSEHIFKSIEKDIDWISIKFGELLLFNQNLPHGNRVNTESETRWSINCRFKGVFTPYADKALGEFFEPITLKPASRIGIDYFENDERK